MISKEEYNNGIRCRGICNWCKTINGCYQYYMEIEDKYIEKTTETKMITITKEEYDKLKEQAFCGCGICLSHHNMKCPKLTKEEQEDLPELTITTSSNENIKYNILCMKCGNLYDDNFKFCPNCGQAEADV